MFAVRCWAELGKTERWATGRGACHFAAENSRAADPALEKSKPVHGRGDD